MGSIYLIRHGQASFGAANYDVLSPLGVRQSQLLGDYFGQLGVSFSRVYTGSLQRQKDTAQSALEHCAKAGLSVPSLEIDPGFNEFDAERVITELLPVLLRDQPNALQILQEPAKHSAAFQQLFSQAAAHWVSGQYSQPTHYLWKDFLGTVEQSFNAVLERVKGQESVAIFTSGGTITALMHLLTQMPASKAFELTWQIVNTSVSRLHVRQHQATLAFFNSRAHLELLKAPELITNR